MIVNVAELELVARLTTSLPVQIMNAHLQIYA